MTKRTKLALLSGAFFGFAALQAPVFADGLTVEDLANFNRVMGPVASPNGEHVAYVMRETDLAADQGRTDIWVLDVAGGEPRRLTQDSASDFDPQWSPDGQWVYFLSTRSGSSQIWRIAARGGEAQQVSDYPASISNLRLSADGHNFVFSASLPEGCADLACAADHDASQGERLDTGTLHTRMFVRHWDSWEAGDRNVLFSARLNRSGSAGAPVNLSGELDGDSPSMPFGGREEFTISPDGRSVYFALREAGASEPWSTDLDIYRVAIDGRGEIINLTADRDGTDTQPQVSPNGQTLAWLSMDRATYEADQLNIWLMDLESGQKRNLTANWDRSVSDFAFSDDGQTLYLSAGDTGTHPIFKVDVASGEVTALTQGKSANSPTVAGDHLVYVEQSLAAPADLYAQPLAGGERRQLTAANADALAAIEMGEYEQFSFEGAAGETVYGYVMKPAGYEEGEDYPVAFIIHGGPQGSFSEGWSYRWNPQTYAGAGYGVVFIDFHGSSGYGQAFTDSINQDWGGKPLEDLQKGLAAATDRYDWLDSEKVCALGASYGGYMINWIAGNWADRFTCLVNHDGLFDLRSFYYSTEELWFPEWDFGGPYYENAEVYERWNPVNHVQNWQTPMLVIQGEKDFRVPTEQSLGAFTALQRQGIESELLVFPDENHWVLSPNNSLQWHHTVINWLDRHLKADSED